MSGGVIDFKFELLINMGALSSQLAPDQLEALMVGLARVMAASKGPQLPEREGAG